MTPGLQHGIGPGTSGPAEFLVVAFANTIHADRFGMHDAISTPRDLGIWLHRQWPSIAEGMPPRDTKADERDRQRFVELRDAIRCIATELTGGPEAPAQALLTLNRAAKAAPLWPQLARDGKGWRRTLGSDGPPTAMALAAIARSAQEVFSGSPQRLEACGAPGCVLFFVRDHPRRQWCSDACGNRARQARHAMRRRNQRAR